MDKTIKVVGMIEGSPIEAIGVISKESFALPPYRKVRFNGTLRTFYLVGEVWKHKSHNDGRMELTLEEVE